MTPEEIQAARALVEATTPGPWWPRYGGEPGEVYASAANRHVATVHGERADGLPRPDSKFIAAARSLVPRLLDALEQARYAASEALQSYHLAMNRAEAAVVEARKAALHEAADAVGAELGRSVDRTARVATWLRARADAQGSTLGIGSCAQGSTPPAAHWVDLVWSLDNAIDYGAPADEETNERWITLGSILPVVEDLIEAARAASPRRWCNRCKCRHPADCPYGADAQGSTPPPAATWPYRPDHQYQRDNLRPTHARTPDVCVEYLGSQTWCHQPEAHPCHAAPRSNEPAPGLGTDADTSQSAAGSWPFLKLNPDREAEVQRRIEGNRSARLQAKSTLRVVVGGSDQTSEPGYGGVMNANAGSQTSGTHEYQTGQGKRDNYCWAVIGHALVPGTGKRGRFACGLPADHPVHQVRTPGPDPTEPDDLDTAELAAIRADALSHPNRPHPYCRSCVGNIIRLADALKAARARECTAFCGDNERDRDAWEAPARAAEVLCVVFGGLGLDNSDREKAAIQAWMEWHSAYGDSAAPISPQHEAELAALRDQARAATLARLRADVLDGP